MHAITTRRYHPITESPNQSLFHDQDAEKTLFRIVVKNNLTRAMAAHFLSAFNAAFEFLDAVDFSKLHEIDISKLRHKDQMVSNHC